MGVNRVWTHRLFAPIPVSSTGQALTFPRKRGKGFRVIQRSPYERESKWGGVAAYASDRDGGKQQSGRIIARSAFCVSIAVSLDSYAGDPVLR